MGKRGPERQYTEQLHLMVTSKLLGALRAHANKKGTTVSKLVREWIERGLR